MIQVAIEEGHCTRVTEGAPFGETGAEREISFQVGHGKLFVQDIEIASCKPNRTRRAYVSTLKALDMTSHKKLFKNSLTLA